MELQQPRNSYASQKHYCPSCLLLPPCQNLLTPQLCQQHRPWSHSLTHFRQEINPVSLDNSSKWQELTQVHLTEWIRECSYKPLHQQSTGSSNLQLMSSNEQLQQTESHSLCSHTSASSVSLQSAPQDKLKALHNFTYIYTPPTEQTGSCLYLFMSQK